MKQLLAALVFLALPLSSVAGEPTAPEATEPIVFTAEILSTRTRAPAPGKRLLTTDVELALRTCIRGPCPERAVVQVPGGRLGDIEQWVEDALPPRTGAVVAVTLPQVTVTGLRDREVPGSAAGVRTPFARLLELSPPRSAIPTSAASLQQGSRTTSPPVRTPTPSR